MNTAQFAIARNRYFEYRMLGKCLNEKEVDDFLRIKLLLSELNFAVYDTRELKASDFKDVKEYLLSTLEYLRQKERGLKAVIIKYFQRKLKTWEYSPDIAVEYTHNSVILRVDDETYYKFTIPSELR